MTTTVALRGSQDDNNLHNGRPSGLIRYEELTIKSAQSLSFIGHHPQVPRRSSDDRGQLMQATRSHILLTALTMVAAAMPSFAADLGGNCCADLEERIAELESTTARKGNRKVSLTISGYVNESVTLWDDGQERNAYVGTNALEQSRVRFLGQAKIAEGWNAGYLLELGTNGNSSKAFSQDDLGRASTVTVRKSSWFIENKALGKLTVGLDGTATYHLIDDADAASTRNFSDFEAAGSYIAAFKTRSNGLIGPKWSDLMGGFNNATPGQSGRSNAVRYDSPSFAGFVVTAAWGEDDLWDAALTYKNDAGDFKITARAGYGESTDSAATKGQCALGAGVRLACQWWGAGATVMHAPTGLYVYGGYGSTSVDLGPGQAGLDGESNSWFVQGGIEHKWSALGKTTLYGEYRNDNAGLSAAGDNSNLDFWSAGLVQNFDAAAMDMYILYRNYDGDFNARGAADKTELDNFDMVIAGAKIAF